MHVEEIDIQNVVWLTLDPGNNWTHARGWMCVCDWQRWKQDGGGLAGSSHSEDRGPQGPSCCFLCHRLPLAHAPRMVVFHAQANPLRQVLLSCLLPFRELKFGPAEDTRNKYPSWEWSQGLLRWTHHLFIFKILITFFHGIYFDHILPPPLTPLRFFLPLHPRQLPLLFLRLTLLEKSKPGKATITKTSRIKKWQNKLKKKWTKKPK